MAYTYRLYNSIHEVPREAWMRLRTGEADLYMDPRFLAAVEETIATAQRFWSLLVYDDGHRPVGSASLCLYPLDAAVLCPTRPRRVLQAIRRVWPRCLLLPVLFCGLPFSAGQSHLRIAAGADVREVLRQIDLATTRLAAESHAVAIVCKEFSDSDLSHTDYLRQLGYVCGPSLPMNYFVAGFRDFEEFCAALRSHYRYKIRRSQRKFAAAGFRVAHFRGAECFPITPTRCTGCILPFTSGRRSSSSCCPPSSFGNWRPGAVIACG